VATTVSLFNLLSGKRHFLLRVEEEGRRRVVADE
jgi:hypothetical protein